MLKWLNDIYGLNLNNICLYRDMIGSVYFLWEKDKRYVYKIYRTFDTKAAIQSTQIITYLKTNNFPVVNIIPTKQNELYSKLEMPEGNRVGILFKYIDGKEPEIKEDIFIIGKLTGGKKKGLPIVYGEVAHEGEYHYYPEIEYVKNILKNECFKILKESISEGYHHFLVQKS